jgi:hypothetical protein
MQYKKCKRGHLRSPENLTASRTCKQCEADRERSTKCKTQRKAYRKTNHESCRAATKAWNKVNVKRCRAKKRAWDKAHPEKLRAMWTVKRHKRRARKFGAGGTFSAQQFIDLCNFCGNCCLCCHRSAQELSSLGLMLVPDHVLPLSKGGSNDISNIQPLCHGLEGCNGKKIHNTH